MKPTYNLIGLIADLDALKGAKPSPWRKHWEKAINAALLDIKTGKADAK